MARGSTSDIGVRRPVWLRSQTADTPTADGLMPSAPHGLMPSAPHGLMPDADDAPLQRPSQVDGTTGGSAARHAREHAHARRDAPVRPPPRSSSVFQVSDAHTTHTHAVTGCGAAADFRDFGVQPTEREQTSRSSTPRCPTPEPASIIYRSAAPRFIPLISNHVADGNS